MKPFNELTRIGQLRRIRKLAEVALEEYGLKNARLTFLHYEGNVIFRVDVPDTVAIRTDGVFMPNRYNLRILSMNDPGATEAELCWLTALRDEARLPVPEPVPTLNGKLLTTVATPGVPNGKVVSLMRWVEGQQLTVRSLRHQHVKAWGRLVGRLHRFASDWVPPNDFKRFHWNWNGILGNGVLRTPVDELVAMMPQPYQEPFKMISSETRAAMEDLGTGCEVYGMIHTDMYLENVLFKAGKPRVIDFEDCGFGYYLYDLGIILSQWVWNTDMAWFRDVFLGGYAETNSLSDRHLKILNLFIATRFADFTLWGTAFIKNDPARGKEHEDWRNESGDSLLRYYNERKFT